MSNLISREKRYKTRDGRDVRVLCVDADIPDYPVIALLEGLYVLDFSEEGLFDKTSLGDYDLIEQPEDKTVWLEIYRYTHWKTTDYNGIRYYMSEQKLQDHIETMKEDSKNYKLIAIKKITYVEGEGI